MRLLQHGYGNSRSLKHSKPRLNWDVLLLCGAFLRGTVEAKLLETSLILQFDEEAAVLIAACTSPGYSHISEPLRYGPFATINLVSPHYKKVNRASQHSKPGKLLPI